MKFMKQWKQPHYLLLWRDVVEGQLRHESHMVVVSLCPLCHFRFLTSVDCNIFFLRLNSGLIKILYDTRKSGRRFLSPFPTPPIPCHSCYLPQSSEFQTVLYSTVYLKFLSSNKVFMGHGAF